MNVVADLGGVLFTWDPAALVAEVFREPGAREKVWELVYRHPDWAELDRGTLDLDEATSRAAARTGLPREEMERFFEAVPPALEPMPDTLSVLRKVKAGKSRLYYLSNMQPEAMERILGYPVWEVFDGGVFSCNVHLVKPEPEIYAWLLERYGLEARQTVFIDDVQENLDAAAAMGLDTIIFTSAGQLEADLADLGCI